MSKENGTEDYEVGYGKPPESGQFRKGVSGNPSGRPKKVLDFELELKQELDSQVIINEGGQRKVIKKSLGLTRQLVNKALSGNLQATRLILDFRLRSEEREAERQQRYPTDPESVKHLTDEELEAIARGIFEIHVPDDMNSKKDHPRD